ncbi:hypothetical protein GCM10027290_11670 [Micromonospora sonneratiae]|uniref:Cupin domain-containing protein n=1 Tax=Micromonospora sonneratiae TaxID=1184706 RepID=A0ABW3YE43_9ACTN
MSAGTIVQSPDGTEIVLGEIGQRILLVNSRVRVWEVTLQPGGTQPWHLHHNPYVVLCLRTSDCRMDWLDGTPPWFIREEVGGAIYRPVSPVHMLTNYGDTTYRNRLIELLDLGEEASGQPPVGGDAAARTGEGTSSELSGSTSVLEIDEVHVRRLTVAPGTEQTWTAGRLPVVVVPLEGSPAVDASPDGGVRYLAPGADHTFANPGPLPCDFQIIELAYLGD